MFYLHAANRTENLLRHLAFVLENDRHPDIFATELLLIQSQGMERMVAQGLADHFGCCCNFKFFLPLDFLGFIAGQLDLGISPDGFQRQILTWRLEGLLRELSGEEYRPLRQYLAGENRELKRFQLARRLANIFDQYQVLRPDLLANWENGRMITGHPAEGWQRALWLRLLAQPSGNVHRGLLFHRILSRLGGQEDLGHLLPKRISIIGLHTMPPVFLEYLNRLAGHMDVHLLLLSPCRHYWGDAESRRAQFKRLMRQPLAEREVNTGHHPLLAALGQQGRDFHNMLLESGEIFEESEGYEQPLAGGEYLSAPLLARIQADLLDDQGNILPVQTPADDDSVRLVSCHSRLRELQVLKDHLLFLLHRDGELQLREIVVMAPDIQEYATLIPAVFADIQHSIADRSLRRRNGVIAAFLQFFTLFTGRFGWSEVFDLLRQPSIYPQLQMAPADLDVLQQWIIGSGIRWGLSGKQRGEDGLPQFAETSWRAGLERLLMGCAIDGSEAINGILPYPDIEGRGALPLGGLCRFIEILEQARRDFQQSKSLALWSTTLLHYGRQLFGDSDDQDLAELHAILAEPGESASIFHDGPLDFAVIHHWLQLSTRESRSSSGFLRGQLTFCSMLPMRSIPFRVVCLLGLCDGEFPKNDRHDTFDLMAAEVRPGDRSPRTDDRYLFLEALLAARSHLYLSYVGQSNRSGEAIPPSTVVAEFLEVLETCYGVINPVVNHPLHPFSSKYFAHGGDGRLFSYSDYHCRTAKNLRQGGAAKGRWWQGCLDTAIATVHLADLLRFAAHPQKYFVSDILGIRQDLGMELPEEREVFSSVGLERYQVDQELLRFALNGRMQSGFEKVLAEGRWPLATPGYLALKEKRRVLEDFLARAEGESLGKPLPALPLDIEVGRYRLVGTLTDLHDRGMLLLRFGTLRGRDLLCGWVQHLVAQFLQPRALTRIVAADQTIRFTGSGGGPGLERILELFAEGSRRPLPLFLEPGLEYVRQEGNSRARSTPMAKALGVYHARMENGYEPEWTLLYGTRKAEEVLDAEFLDLCREILFAVWSNADGS